MTNPHIETLVNFLRDFADANADSFDPEQIEYLKQSSHAIIILDEAVDNLVKERDDAYAQIDRYKNGYEGGCYACEVVAVRNQELLAERDEARRMYCKAVADHYEYACNAELDGAGPYTQKDVAKDEGWDCFKEESK